MLRAAFHRQWISSFASSVARRSTSQSGERAGRVASKAQPGIDVLAAKHCLVDRPLFASSASDQERAPFFVEVVQLHSDDLPSPQSAAVENSKDSCIAGTLRCRGGGTVLDELSDLVDHQGSAIERHRCPDVFDGCCPMVGVASMNPSRQVCVSTPLSADSMLFTVTGLHLLGEGQSCRHALAICDGVPGDLRGVDRRD